MKIRFLEGTPLEVTEMEMQQIPGFRQEKSGMTVSRLEIKKKECGQVAGSHVIDEMGMPDLFEAFSDEVEFSPFTDRLSRLSEKEIPLFNTAMHRQRFERLWPKMRQEEGRSGQGTAEGEDQSEGNAMCAAIYLLTADAFLWARSVMCIQPGRIDFDAFRIHGVDMDGYVVFHIAKDLYAGRRHVRLSELVDPELVSDAAFRLIVIAFLLRRYGEKVLPAERSGRC